MKEAEKEAEFGGSVLKKTEKAKKVMPIAFNMYCGSGESRKKAADGLIAATGKQGAGLFNCAEGRDGTGFMCILIEKNFKFCARYLII